MAVQLSPTTRYVSMSVLLASLIVWHAFSTREQYFPAMTYLASSKLSLAVLGNLGFACTLCTYKLITKVFLGALREAEIEHVNDRLSQSVVESCLAMTIFREDMGAWSLALFVLLSFAKALHWLLADRVDFVGTAPSLPPRTHVGLVGLGVGLLILDCAALHLALAQTLRHGVSVHLLFAFECTVVASAAAAALVKYALAVTDSLLEGRWSGRGVARFYLDLALDLLHLCVYVAFFAAVFSTYGIPLHLLRDVYSTARGLHRRVRDFLRYRRLTANMDARFADATEEDLRRAGGVCVVCREELPPAQPAGGGGGGPRAKRLACGHAFHLHCLRAWLERQQLCPVCRAPVQALAEQRRGEAAPGARPRGRPRPAPQQQQQPQPRQRLNIFGRQRLFLRAPVPPAPAGPPRAPTMGMVPCLCLNVPALPDGPADLEGRRRLALAAAAAAAEAMRRAAPGAAGAEGLPRGLEHVPGAAEAVLAASAALQKTLGRRLEALARPPAGEPGSSAQVSAEGPCSSGLSAATGAREESLSAATGTAGEESQNAPTAQAAGSLAPNAGSGTKESPPQVAAPRRTPEPEDSEAAVVRRRRLERFASAHSDA